MAVTETTLVRPLDCQAEYEAAVVLQEQIWGADVRETVAASVLQVSREVGGIADGAFTAEGKLVGFVFGLTGIRNGKLAHWSHILAVEKAWRNRGIGRLLKYHQRKKLLEIPVDAMYWTFDPLESRNAHLNLNKLGATVEAYVPNFYGTDAIAKTDTVIGTDRFVVRWDLLQSSTSSTTRNLVLADIPCATDRLLDCGTVSSKTGMQIAERYVRVEVPADIQTLKLSNPTASTEWRENTRAAFVHYLDAGYRVVEFRPGSPGCEGNYVLEVG